MYSNGDVKTDWDSEHQDAEDSPTAIISRAFDAALSNIDSDGDQCCSAPSPGPGHVQYPFEDTPDKIPDKKSGDDGGYINMDTGTSQPESIWGLKGIFGIAEVVGIVLVILTGVWCGPGYLGGFAWRENPGLQFNLHPLLMVIALVFLGGNGIMTYRVLRTVRKAPLKWLHGAQMFLALPLCIVGLIAVFDFHNLVGIPNLYSLHSWVGLIAVILFFAQYLLGFTAFLFPGWQQDLRRFFMPLHVFFGIAIFELSIAACLLGLNEKAIFKLDKEYSKFVPEGVLINVIGLFLITFAGLVTFLVSKPEYKRQPRPEDSLPLIPSRL